MKDSEHSRWWVQSMSPCCRTGIIRPAVLGGCKGQRDGPYVHAGQRVQCQGNTGVFFPDCSCVKKLLPFHPSLMLCCVQLVLGSKMQKTAHGLLQDGCDETDDAPQLGFFRPPVPWSLGFYYKTSPRGFCTFGWKANREDWEATAGGNVLSCLLFVLMSVYLYDNVIIQHYLGYLGSVRL